MAKKNRSVPQYGTVMRKGILYYRTRIQDADGKQVSLYATTCEELYEKQQAAKKQVEEIVFRRKHPTVAEYCEKWLLMQSAKVSSATMKGYTSDMRNYIIKPLGDMYMEEVTADDIRLALVPLTKKSEGLYNTVNMLIKCIFYSAERSELISYNPCVGISAKGGKPTKKKDALTDQQVEVLLDTVKGLPPYLFIMICLYSGLRREEALGLQWDCVFLDAPTPYISVRRAWRSERNFTHTHFELRVTFWTSIYGLSYGNPISATKHNSQAPCCPAPIPCYILAGVRHCRTFATYFGALRRIWTLFAYFGIFCVTFISDWIEQIQIYVIKLVSKMVTSDLSARINDVLRYVGITRNMNAYIILSQALTLIAEDEDRLRAVEKEVYTPIADKKPYEPKAVQSTIRRASKVAWDLCPDHVQELAGYPLNGRPSAVTMLELLYNGVARYDDLSILK